MGINISELIRRSLEGEVRRRKMEAVLEALRREVEGSRKLPHGTVVSLLREMRERG